MLNVVALMGRLVADPQLRQTQTGRRVASMRIACDRGGKDAAGNRQADFLDVVAWDNTAEFVCRNFAKGELIALSGRLQSREFRDRTGANRHVVEVVAGSVSFAGARRTAPGAAPVPTVAEREVPPIQDEGDLPF